MYDDNHKYFLQYMLQNNYISIKDALNFCNKLPIDTIKDVKDLKEFISVINEKISKQYLKISLLKCEVTGENKLALLNTANDSISKLQNIFQPLELEYFQLLLHELITREDHQIKKMECYNLNTTTKKISIDSIEKLLRIWCKQGYLVEKNPYVYLGARCVVEFAPYFDSHCKDYYSNCYLCSEAVFVGSICSSCQHIMHHHCMEKYVTKHKKCPSCKHTWNEAESSSQSSIEMNDNENLSSSENEIYPPRKTRRVLQ